MDQLNAVNQLLTPIGNTSFDLLEQAKQHDILVEAYSPVAHGEILQNEQINEWLINIRFPSHN